MKIDVAILSYKKPESLIYTLMSLKKYCSDYIDTIYIQDDCSNDGTVDYYQKPEIIAYFQPWKIMVRENDSPVRWHRVYVKGYSPAYYNRLDLKIRKFKRHIKGVKEEPIVYHRTDDIRYQWAINQTDKKYLLVIHDDIEFYDNIVNLYLSRISSNTAIVGDLGQCWKCKFESKCNPVNIMKKEYPKDKNIFRKWPYNTKRVCRINEWCCLINVKIARQLEIKERIFFGNYDHGGDVGAYWFLNAIKTGFQIDDPLPSAEQRIKYYLHCWQGMSGHSVWVDQGAGKKEYNIKSIYNRMMDVFGITL